MPDEIVLYDHAASPCARRVRIALLEKGLAWRSRPIDLEHMEQKSPWYLALNPNGIVPTLQHGDRVIWESNVITEYLDAVFPDPPLYPPIRGSARKPRCGRRSSSRWRRSSGRCSTTGSWADEARRVARRGARAGERARPTPRTSSGRRASTTARS
jgi:glutathione S-transferase